MRALRRHMQLIFQDPFASLNPRMTVDDTLAEPLMLHGLAPPATTARARRRAAAPRRPEARPGARAIRTSSPAASASASSSPERWRASPSSSSATSRCRRSTCRSAAQILNLLRDLQRQLGLALRVHLARSRGGEAYRRPRRGDVSRPHRRDRAGRRDFRRSAPSLHARASVGDSGALARRPGATARSCRATFRARSTRRPAAISMRAART